MFLIFYLVLMSLFYKIDFGFRSMVKNGDIRKYKYSPFKIYGASF